MLRHFHVVAVRGSENEPEPVFVEEVKEVSMRKAMDRAEEMMIIDRKATRNEIDTGVVRFQEIREKLV